MTKLGMILPPFSGGTMSLLGLQSIDEGVTTGVWVLSSPHKKPHWKLCIRDEEFPIAT